MDKKDKAIPNFERRESSQEGLKQKVIEAVKSRDVDRLISALKELNNKLVDLELGHFSKNGIERLKKEITIFFDKIKRWQTASLIVYLGDAGSSRLRITVACDDEVDLQLINYSTNDVKVAWNEI